MKLIAKFFHPKRFLHSQLEFHEAKTYETKINFQTFIINRMNVYFDKYEGSAKFIFLNVLFKAGIVMYQTHSSCFPHCFVVHVHNTDATRKGLTLQDSGRKLSQVYLVC